MKNLPFISELTEARMFQSAKDFKGMSGHEVGEIVYLMIMMLEVIRHQNPNWASNYAQQTLSYSTYDNTHYAGTDLANLLAVLNNQNTFAGWIKVDNNVAMPLFQINRYLRALNSKHIDHNEDATFFWRLEDYLKLYSNSSFRQMRRDIGNWLSLTHSDKMRMVMKLRQMFDSRGSSTDIYLWFRQSYKMNESIGANSERCYMDELFERLVKSGSMSESQLLESREGLLENQDQITAVKKFFKLHKQQSLTPTVGKFYAPIGIIFAGLAKILVISTTSEPVELVSMNAGQDYKFMIDGRLQRFPNNANIYTSIGDTLFYASVEEANSMMTLASMQIQFPGWKVEYELRESMSEDIDTKLAYNKTLNPDLWDSNNELHADVKAALGKIANKFSEFVDIKQLKIVDYIITGSNCAFNYTSQSDIDLHVLIDGSALGDNPLTAPFLLAKKSLWNSGHDITVKGYTVELYAEDVNNEEDKLVATGVYSLLHDKWIKRPKHINIQIDDAAVRSKAEDIMAQIDSIIDSKSTDVSDIERLWNHIRKMRKAGLEKGGEFDVSNLAFKAVRNNDYFNKLKDYEHRQEDADLTLEHRLSAGA